MFKKFGGFFQKSFDGYFNKSPTLQTLNTQFFYCKNDDDIQFQNINQKPVLIKEQQNQEKQAYIKVSMIPIIYIISQKLNDVKCIFWEEKYKTNYLKNRIAHLQYAANSPIEDRLAIDQLQNLEGFLLSVFDGHGGWQVAEFAKNNLANDFDEILKKNLLEEDSIENIIIKSLEQAYDTVENNFLQMAQRAYDLGFSNTGRVGACSLSVLIHNNKLYAANSGDCKGVICTGDKVITCKKINNKFNANSKKEQQRLKSLFSNEKDIVICRKGNNKACYVKNMLQPTRSFGDFRLKYKEFNNPKNYDLEQGFPHQISTFTGPYITHKPDIKTFELTKKDKYLIMASDGLWDELNEEQIANIVQENLGDKLKIVNELYDQAILKAAKDANISKKEIQNKPLGARRSFHDDITILVVDLQNQVK